MPTADRWIEVLKRQAEAEELALARIAAYREELLVHRRALAAEISRLAAAGRPDSAPGAVILVRMHESERLRDSLAGLDDRIAQAAVSEHEQAERVVKARQAWEVAVLLQEQRDHDREVISLRRNERQWQDFMTTLKASERNRR